MRGACLCGAVAWEADGLPGAMWHCHCRACRKAGGAGHATWLEVEAAAFRFARGAAQVVRYASSPGRERAFCARCGSTLPWASDDGRRTWLPAGALAADPGVRPEGHAFAAERAPWQAIGSSATPLPEAAPARVPGSCLCGDVRYDLAPALDVIWHCHCSRDRRASGALYDACVGALPDAIRWHAGRARLVRFKLPEAERYTTCFCPRCGGPAPLPEPLPGGGPVCAPAGALDADPGIRPALRIFWGSRAVWDDTVDALPRHETRPPPRP